MPLQDSYTQYSRGSVTLRDRYGRQRSSSVTVLGSFATQVATIIAAIANASNAAAIESDSGLKARADLPYTAFDEAEQAVTSVLVLKFHQDAGDPNDFNYVEIPAFDASLLLTGQPFADPAQTQIAAIIGAMDTAGYTYVGSFITTRKAKSLKQVILPGLDEPGEGLLPADLPALGGEEP